jgi:hypothetical protein
MTDLKNTAINATNMAQIAEHNFQPAVQMPTPNIN